MNVWRRGSLLENPYYRTAFQVARVPPEVEKHATLVKLVGMTRRLIQSDPQAHAIQGRPVTEAELNEADHVLGDVRRRIAEELLEHPTEQMSLETIQGRIEEVAAVLAGEQSGPLPVMNLAGLNVLLEALVGKAMAAGVVDPSFGALELELTPPWGRTEGE